MKRIWKKINRGILLGGVLLVLLIGFIVIKEVQFRTESPGIRDTARDAVEAILELNLSEGETVIGQVRPTDVQARQRERLETMLTQYWDAEGSKDFYPDAGGIRTSYEEYLRDPVLARFYEIDLNIPDSAVTVRQNGTDYAVVSFGIDNLAARYAGEGETIFCGEYYGAEGALGIALGEYVGSYHGYVDMELHRTGGQWRVCGMSMWLNLVNKVPAETETGGVQ